MNEEQRSRIIEYLVTNLDRPGKVKLQKTMYFLQEALQVPMGYDYVMHYYGPYSFELDYTLSEMQGKGILKIDQVIYPAGYYGYDISSGENVERDLKLPSEYTDKADQVTHIFKPMDAQAIELWATIHFVGSILKEKGRDSGKEAITKEVKLLKPKFSEQDIGEAYDKIQELRLS